MTPRYLVDAVDEIVRALSSSKESRHLTVTRALMAACTALNLLDQDLSQQQSTLAASMRHLEDLRKKYLKELSDELNLLLIRLHDFEDRLLADAGVPRRVRAFIRSESEKVTIDPSQPLISPGELRDRLGPLRQEVCAEAGRLQSAFDTEDLARRSAYVLGGVTLISINASVDAATTAGTIPWLTALSGPAGGGLIVKSGIFDSKKR